jgi:hypothetical protein
MTPVTSNAIQGALIKDPIESCAGSRVVKDSAKRSARKKSEANIHAMLILQGTTFCEVGVHNVHSDQAAEGKPSKVGQAGRRQTVWRSRQYPLPPRIGAIHRERAIETLEVACGPSSVRHADGAPPNG